jgi:hypothetical protein
LKNNVGADAQAVVGSLVSINDNTNTTVPLQAPSFINRTINLNRAVETGSTVIPYYFITKLDKSNSNIVEFAENLPGKIMYNIRLQLNPLGNISGHNDFVYTDDIFSANLDIRFPFRFGAEQVMLTDTLNITVANKEDYDRIGDGKFTLFAENGFPFEMQLQLLTMNENNTITDSLFIPAGMIRPAPVNAELRATGTTLTNLEIPVSQTRKDNLLNAVRIIVKSRFSTVGYPQTLQLYSDYQLKLQLVGDAKYKIR